MGAVATQCFQNASYGPRGLELLENGLTPEEVVAELIRKNPGDTDYAKSLEGFKAARKS